VSGGVEIDGLLVAPNSQFIREIQYFYHDSDCAWDGTQCAHYEWTYTKKRDDTDLLFMWHDNFRVINGWARWRIRVDNKNCIAPRILEAAHHAGSGDDHHDPRSFYGFCTLWEGDTTIPAGDHAIKVFEEGDGGDANSGWNMGSYMVISEIYAELKE
jgi:hypothetical protein